MTAVKEGKDLGGKRYREIEPLDENEAQLVKLATRCLTTALDHSNAQKIILRQENKQEYEFPTLELPPKVLRVVARVLTLMGERRPILMIPQEHELSTQEAASMLNVSRPFIIKEIEAGKLKCRMVGTHRRITYDDLRIYREEMKKQQEQALQDLADDAQELGLGY